MSVVGENRSPLPFPQIERNKTSHILNSPPEEVTGEDAAALGDAPIGTIWSEHRIQLAVASVLISIIFSSLFVLSRGGTSENQKLALQPTAVFANQDRPEVHAPAKPSQLKPGQLKTETKTGPEAESSGSLFDVPVTPTALVKDREAFVAKIPVSTVSVANIGSDLFGDKPVEEPKTTIAKDSTNRAPELPKNEDELVVDSEVFFGPAPAPQGYQAPNTPVHAVLPKYGTAISWMPSLNDATRWASKNEKLVFLLQVSGNFAIEEFT